MKQLSNTLAPLLVLKILQQYTDENHKLTQNQICEKLADEYGISAERKKIGRILKYLTDAGYYVENTKNGCYIDGGDFDDTELRLLIDSVLFSKHIPANYAEDLIKKLKDLGSVSFREKAKGVFKATSLTRTSHKVIFHNIDVVSQAISEKQSVSFYYNIYDLDAKLHRVTDNKYEMYPYLLLAKNNNYYVVGEEIESKKILNMRLEKISEIEIIPSTEKNIDFNADKYLSEHPYMLIGKIITATIKIDLPLIDDFIDKFGKNFTVIGKDEKSATIRLDVSDSDLTSWAKENGNLVEIVSPQYLRDQLREFSTRVTSKYHQSENDRYNSAIETAKLCKKTKRPHICLANIDLRNKTEHEDLTYLTHVQFLNNHLDNFDFLESFEDLQVLTVENNPVKDLSCLENCRNLKSLEIKNTNVIDLSFIKTLDNLEDLRLINNKTEDYSVIYNLFNLRSLTLSARDALFFDPHKLRRSCPHLTIETTPFENEFELSDDEYRRLKAVLSICRKRKFKDVFFNKQESEIALKYIETHSEFPSWAFHKGITKLCPKEMLEFPEATFPILKAEAILAWLVETGRLSYDKTDHVYYHYEKEE